jgi:hypothetical protein
MWGNRLKNTLLQQRIKMQPKENKSTVFLDRNIEFNECVRGNVGLASGC